MSTRAAAPDPDVNLLLSRQLCFALHSTTLALGRVYARALAPLDLTYTQYLAMLVLWETDAIPVKRLGARLMLDSGTLTPLLKRMEAAGLVARRRDPDDERRVLVTLTEAGAALKEAARDVPARIGAACSVSGVDLAALKGDLEALRSALSGPSAGAPPKDTD
ncbi:MarR family winged helix-turn-helix transcriptional regulator [Stappia sp. ES.058]|uniref:MarR family winged helix-turn-helix transcriptional regulator n=1 Tax=Stappia sp. ES.058 TaxID=1881061 RepID=UPI00087D410C|nr:MarR family transcriptional regulator [Stappia sp. ES.058]SDU39560.1 DNA-binding transcriptional regulator, MarR family [Stappia sp. ES.058]